MITKISAPSNIFALTALNPPDAVPSAPPVSTRIQKLPFEALTWENFERLCCRLTQLEGNVEYCARYGQQGEAQEGIDIFARQKDGRYHCLQAKRHHSFGASKLLDAVDLFLKGSWASRASRFTIVVQSSLGSVTVQEEIERQTTRLAKCGIAFSAYGGDILTDHLRTQPRLIDDFFGRPWVTAFLGQEIADSLGTRLDGSEFTRVRSQLARVYETQFHFVDPGSFGSISDEDSHPALSLLERFLKPDFLVREIRRHTENTSTLGANEDRMAMGSATPHIPIGDNTKVNTLIPNSRMRRLPLCEWIGDAQRLVVLGEAGCGKSTLLRVIALDLLYSQAIFPDLAIRWGQHIPIYIPFARWASQATKDKNPIGLKEIIRRSLEPLLTSSLIDLLDRAIDDKRILLLIDGLDEWSNEQAARSTLSTLVTTVEAHDISVFVSGRPRGLTRIGALPANWKRGTVAPLSSGQQTAIAERWFQRYTATPTSETGISGTNLRTEQFMTELARDASLGALATVPLLLIGLVTLALRGQILPRTRRDIYDQLVQILLEVHPSSRATAAGDTEQRFRHTDSYQRRAAIARLAFAMREQTGGVAYNKQLHMSYYIPISHRQMLSTYLTA